MHTLSTCSYMQTIKRNPLVQHLHRHAYCLTHMRASTSMSRTLSMSIAWTYAEHTAHDLVTVWALDTFSTNLFLQTTDIFHRLIHVYSISRLSKILICTHSISLATSNVSINLDGIFIFGLPADPKMNAPNTECSNIALHTYYSIVHSMFQA